MKFIFPQNYHFKNKIFGIIDYTTAFVNLVWYIFVFTMVHFLFHSIQTKVTLFILLCFPLFLFSFAGFHGENIVDVFCYLFQYFRKQKLYFYSKNYQKFS